MGFLRRKILAFTWCNVNENSLYTEKLGNRAVKVKEMI
jgi:hypothetical protein